MISLYTFGACITGKRLHDLMLRSKPFLLESDRTSRNLKPAQNQKMRKMQTEFCVIKEIRFYQDDKTFRDMIPEAEVSASFNK